MKYLENFFNVFFGSVRRMQWTLAGLVGIYLLTHPEAANLLFGLLIQILIIVGAFWFIVRKVFGIGPKKKSSS